MAGLPERWRSRRRRVNAGFGVRATA